MKYLCLYPLYKYGICLDLIPDNVHTIIGLAHAQELMKVEGRVKRLTVLRMQRGWTRAELGRRAKMHPASVGKIESGRQVPYRVELVKLARALAIPSAEADTLMEEVTADDGRW